MRNLSCGEQSRVVKGTCSNNKLSATCETLKDQLNAEKQRNLKLEQYTRRENIRLLFVKEEDEENTEEVFIKCLTGNGCIQSRHEISRSTPCW